LIIFGQRADDAFLGVIDVLQLMNEEIIHIADVLREKTHGLLRGLGNVSNAVEAVGCKPAGACSFTNHADGQSALFAKRGLNRCGSLPAAAITLNCGAQRGHGTMAIEVGDALPEVTFTVMTPDGPKTRTTEEIFKGRKVVLIGVPGAFTPTCSLDHLPGYIEQADAFKAKGIDAVAVTGVNDVFVMQAWAKASGGEGKVLFLADGSAVFAKAIGLTVDLTERGLGVRSQRYSMLVEDGIVRELNIEEAPGKAEISAAERLLQVL
jgi:glutaredoxin/glutathione-dependent peroxiredoxin